MAIQDGNQPTPSAIHPDIIADEEGVEPVAVAFIQDGEAEIMELEDGGPETPPPSDPNLEEASFGERSGDQEVPEGAATSGDQDVPEGAAMSLDDDDDGFAEDCKIVHLTRDEVKSFQELSELFCARPEVDKETFSRIYALCFLCNRLVHSSTLRGRFCPPCTVKRMLVLEATELEEEVAGALEKEDLASFPLQNGSLTKEAVTVACDACEKEMTVDPPVVPTKPLCVSCRSDDPADEKSTTMVSACVFCFKPHNEPEGLYCGQCDYFDDTDSSGPVAIPKMELERMRQLRERETEAKNGFKMIEQPVRTRCSYCKNVLVFSPFVLPDEPLCLTCFTRDEPKKKKQHVEAPTSIGELDGDVPLVYLKKTNQ